MRHTIGIALALLLAACGPAPTSAEGAATADGACEVWAAAECIPEGSVHLCVAKYEGLCPRALECLEAGASTCEVRCDLEIRDCE